MMCGYDANCCIESLASNNCKVEVWLDNQEQEQQAVPARAASPVKNMMDLEMDNPPITFLEDYKVSECPPAMNVLLSELLEASEGFRLLPWSLKVRFIL